MVDDAAKIIAQLRADLPMCPDDVITTWLLEFAKEDGWPPPQPLNGPWARLLENRPLTYWQSLTWKSEPVDVRQASFDSQSWDSVVGLVLANMRGVKNDYSGIRDTKVRFDRICDHLRLHGRLPSPPVAIRARHTLHVVDGNHRLAAHWALQAELGLPSPLVWVGRPLVAEQGTA